MYHGVGHQSQTRAAQPRALNSHNLKPCTADAKVMFGTLTLIKRNGSEGSTMTMDSRETTIGR